VGAVQSRVVIGRRRSISHWHKQCLSNVLIVLQRPAFSVAVQRTAELTDRLSRQSQPQAVIVLQLIHTCVNTADLHGKSSAGMLSIGIKLV